jgi:hypothetical protein
VGAPERALRPGERVPQEQEEGGDRGHQRRSRAYQGLKLGVKRVPRIFLALGRVSMGPWAVEELSHLCFPILNLHELGDEVHDSGRHRGFLASFHGPRLHTSPVLIVFLGQREHPCMETGGLYLGSGEREDVEGLLPVRCTSELAKMEGDACQIGDALAIRHGGG